MISNKNSNNHVKIILLSFNFNLPMPQVSYILKKMCEKKSATPTGSNKHDANYWLLTCNPFGIDRTPNIMSTYSRIYIQIVFAVRNRHALIKPEWEERLFQYITGIVRKRG